MWRPCEEGDGEGVLLWNVAYYGNPAKKLLSSVLPEPTTRPADPFAFLKLRGEIAGALER